MLLLLLAVLTVPDDAHLIVRYRAGMESLVRNAALPKTSIPTRDEREEARAVWRSFHDYQVALESIRERHSDFLSLRGDARAREFRLYHAAWLAQYRAALYFVGRMEGHPELHTMLNEDGSYAAFKLHWLHVARAAEWSTFALLDRTAGGTPVPGAAEDAKAILAAGIGHGSKETLRNAARVVGSAAWNPVPDAIEEVAGGPHVAPRPSFVTPKQIAATRALLAPGDLVFERRDWALTNVGLPGFWPHVALYVGTPEERRKAFGDVLETRLRAIDAKRYERLSRATIIEAVGEGVILSTFEKSADADYVAVIRPRVALDVKAEAIARAFAMIDRPYDFEFDFVTDDRIVCSELVFKAYEQRLDLPVARWAGRSVTPPNDYVRWFDEHFDAPGRRADFVAFLDGHAHLRAATEETAAALRASWRRPKWHGVAHRD